MQNPWHIYADSRSRSRLQFMGFTLAFRVRSKSPLPLEGFRWSNVHVSKNGMQTQGQSHSSRSSDLPLCFVSAPCLLYPKKFLHYTLAKCLSQWVGVQNPRLSYADSRWATPTCKTQWRPWRKAFIRGLMTDACLWLGPSRLNLRFSLALIICESWAHFFLS